MPPKKFYKKKSSRVSKAVKKYVSKAITVEKELKFLHTPVWSNSGISSAYSQVSSLQLIPQGSSVSSREGNSVQQLGFKYRVSVLNGDQTNMVRFIMYRRDQGAISSAYVPTIYQPLSPAFTQQCDRVIMDKTIAVNSDSATAGASQVMRTGYIRAKHILHYASSTTGNPIKGWYHVIALSDSGAAPNPSVYFSLDLYYKDN